jgi:BirA family biotin operon repressor/biotin-[acetyl-CoA-carboxylase] ligase
MDFAVVGIGVNVAICTDLFPPEVRETCGTLVSPYHSHASEAREALTVSILDNFSLLYRQFISEGFLGILQKVREYCDMLGREVAVLRLGTPIQGIAVDIDSDARLIIRTKSGENVHVVSGEVRIGVPGAGYCGE